VQIIFVHPKLRQAKTLTISRKHLLVALGSVLFVFSLSSGLLSYAAVNFALHTRIPIVQTWVQQIVGLVPTRDTESKEQFFRQNIDALAAKLGQLQAQISRIDAIGERVATMTGIKPADMPKPQASQVAPTMRAAPAAVPSPAAVTAKAGASGGPFIPAPQLAFDPVRSGSNLNSMAATINQITKTLDQQGDYLALVESEILMQSVRSKVLPTNQPLNDAFMGSRFGSRSDPFTGRTAMHEGLDFSAPTGTPILAAGGGQVITAGTHPSYGNHIDIAHGNGLVTRYAHASKLLVKEGDIVKQGQKIAEVGSTGRSTGSHLHFEVRVNEEAQDPLKYLQAGFNFSKEYAKR
jgi:murein DD-endopeptidase MepM/ murein hydrolase activator NlpD